MSAGNKLRTALLGVSVLAAGVAGAEIAEGVATQDNTTSTLAGQPFELTQQVMSKNEHFIIHGVGALGAVALIGVAFAAGRFMQAVAYDDYRNM